MFHCMYDYKTVCVRYRHMTQPSVPSWDTVSLGKGVSSMKDPNAVYKAGFNSNIVDEKPLLWDYEERAKQTLTEWYKITTDIDSVDASVVTPEIKDSWIRSKRYGLDPFQKVQQRVLTTKELQDLSKEN